MTYRVIWKESGTILSFSGDLSIEEINEANGTLHGDARIESHRYTIWDFLGTNFSSITKDETCKLAATDKFAATYIAKMKVALIAQETHATRICNHYIERAKEIIPDWEFAIFNSMADATKWIDS